MRLTIIICLLQVSQYIPSLYSLDNYTIDSLNTLIQDSAFKTSIRHRPVTGSLYKAPVPVSLSGIEVSIVRLRSKRLWNNGAKFSYFQIPPRTKTVPHVKRLAIVYQNLGNWSSHCYSVPGYKLITPVVSFAVFNATNERAKNMNKIRLDTSGKSIIIRFSNLEVDERMMSKARCAEFYKNGTFRFSEMKETNVCYSKNYDGLFSIVVPLEKEKSGGKKLRFWYLGIIGFVLGFSVLVMVIYLTTLSMKMLKSKRIQVMERQADEDLVLETVWVGNSKMPSATVTRTQPVLEGGGFS